MAHKYTYISTATTTIVRSTQGKLSTIVIGTPSAGSLTLYDNASIASGNIIAVIDTNPSMPIFLEPGVDVANGIVAVTTGTAKITIGTNFQN